MTTEGTATRAKDRKVGEEAGGHKVVSVDNRTGRVVWERVGKRGTVYVVDSAGKRMHEGTLKTKEEALKLASQGPAKAAPAPEKGS